MRQLLLIPFALLALAPVNAQDRDFLTAEEVDQIRLAQDPNERLKLYSDYARARVGQVEQVLSREKPGRSGLLHQLLDDYTKIIEAIDTVADDALRRKVPIEIGMKSVTEAENEMLASLKKIKESKPKDISRYEFSLDQAIDATEDSYDLAQSDLEKRQSELLTKEAKEKSEREAIMKPEEKDKPVEAAATKDDKPKRKAPTLRRPGEEPAKPPAAKR